MEEKERILIVDDDESTCKTLSRIFGKKGYEIETAGTGKEALEKAQAKSFNSTLLDIRLPDIAGVELIEPLKATNPDMVVIMITGHASIENAMQALNEGASAYIIKPLDMDQVLVMVREALEKQALIVENRAIIESLQESEERYSAIFNEARDGMVLIDAETGFITHCNHEFEEQTGRNIDQLKNMKVWEIRPLEKREMAKNKFLEIAETGSGDSGNLEFQKPNGDLIFIEFRSSEIEFGSRKYIQSICRDITAQKQLEEQFRQAQKMEGIGRLAGGVAHDFNNLLTVISGHAELSLMALDPRDPLQSDLKEIQNAADRAADLTRQLLAFSRKQPLQPKVLSLNDIVTELHKMLKRVIGEDIDLVTIPNKNLWNVKADPGQIEQVIINLATNARDAMPKGGKLTIETQNVELDEEYANTHPDVIPGPHVMLAISDTGCGITDEVKMQIFDPFFTTKDKGQGTGLGLSTVYGIVKQSGGNIWVYSELNKGTTFKIYLPMVVEEAEEFTREVPFIELPRGTETVLVVEDEDSVRRLACRVLKQQGYKIIEAQTGGDAYLMCQKMEKPVDLVITDVIMPTMGGVELVEKLREIWSDFKVLLMSGYTSNTIVHNGMIDPGVPYLQKPFRPVDIAWKVRRVLDS